MQISKALNNYINFIFVDSNLLIVNSEKVLLETIYDCPNEKYVNRQVSLFIKDLYNSWSKDKYITKDKCLWIQNDFKPIVKNDTTFYRAQVIYPLFYQNKFDGFIIFFRTKREYIKSSLKPLKTIRHFAELAHNRD